MMVYSLKYKYLFRGEHLGVVQVEGVGAAVEAAAVDPDHDGDPLHPPEDRPGHLQVEAVLGERSVGNPDLTNNLSQHPSQYISDKTRSRDAFGFKNF